MKEKNFIDYVKKHNAVNLKDCIKRLEFLVENFNDSIDFIGPVDVWFCFEEARHSFMVGNFVATIVMCSITIERWLSFLLSIPFYDYSGKEKQQKISDKETLGKLNKYVHKIGLINDSLFGSIERLNELRTNFVHGIDHKTHSRPQQGKMSKFTIMEPSNLGLNVTSLQQDAEEAILILFGFYREHLYLVKSK